ncbi:MAG: dTMP kinase [Candidatus Sumerlaeia bacterium]|nr:dTMP kinase [Candidatus Sumerlaeia bacterium]
MRSPADPAPARGLLVAIEGIDGAGKSTQAELLARWLQSSGLMVRVLHEPTRGPHGMELRRLMPLGPEVLTAAKEFELFREDRRRNVAESIEPTLAAGGIVVLDRYYISSMAYQGARGLDPAEIRLANEAFAPVPDYLAVFDLPVAEALARVRGRDGAGDHFEREERLARARAIFLGLDGFPFMRVVDAMRPVEEVGAVLRADVAALLAQRQSPVSATPDQ